MNGRSLSRVIDDPPMVNVLKFLTENFDILKMTLATFHKFFAECFSIPASLLNALPALTGGKNNWGEKQMIQNHEAKITKMLNPLLISGIGRLFVAVK